MEPIIHEIKSWLLEAGEQIKASEKQQLTIFEKTNRKDLVTNMDRIVQQFLVQKIAAFDPDARILAEEDGYNELTDLTGRVFIIDPIDGTLNFVMEGENFCIMLAMYENGVGQLGFIYDVMQEELYWGGRGIGVYQNDLQLSQPVNKTLEAGLLGMNGYLFAHNKYNIRTIGEKSMGVRITGCAGLEMIAMLKGNHIGYLSNLSPWDYAAGCVLLTEFGFFYSNMNGEQLAFHGRELFVAATPKAFQQIHSFLEM
ncbi:inositol monophosphatase family protein [Enterococcus thailandicus]|uniref:inositol monophosphatase family protein n=1 Tax=Enterococcus thailandicus TaxID=417368 RepID=UPI0022EBDCA9|nr:inositol monophosphatase family protein [Enterococcus thailandicus]MDA3973636.1 inositol monophosphatase family protein [Enterococcus thailandicus]MDA3975780.1 inositol monophosphatase family protein [Enterococcus thailandicus]MDA3981094.1 inositol monophosphatase family protein [Enterococcus thailandicus]